MTDAVDQLLFEHGMIEDAALRRALTQLERDATSLTPMPSPDLAALLAPTGRRSIGRHQRILMTTLIVVGTLGVGATAAAAASPEFRAATQHVFDSVTGIFPPSAPAPSDGGGHETPLATPTASPTASPTATDIAPDSPALPSLPERRGPSDHSGPDDLPAPSDHPRNDGGDDDSKPAVPHESNSATPHSTGAPADPGDTSKPSAPDPF